MRSAPKRAAQSLSPEAIAAEIERVSGLSPKDLNAVWAAEFGHDPPRGLWPDLMVRVLAWRMQEKAFGGHDKATRRLLEAYGRGKPGDVRCARLKPGAALVREFGGVRHTVTIMPDGFVWQEKTYCGHSSRRLAPAAGGLRAWARAGPERLSVGLAASVGRRRGLNLLIGAPHAQSH